MRPIVWARIRMNPRASSSSAPRGPGEAHSHGKSRIAHGIGESATFSNNHSACCTWDGPTDTKPRFVLHPIPQRALVASPPVGQFKSKHIRDVRPIVADEIARPAILCHRVASSQRVRPATKLERRKALELGSRKTFLVLGSQLRQPAPILNDGCRLRGVVDAEKLWPGHAHRLFAAEPSARRGGSADPEDFAARTLVVDHPVVGHVFETLV